jgi:nucleoside-diphosphate-sugar epimerase
MGYKMNILLSGATGFLGSHLLKTFLKNGHNVTVLKRKNSNIKRIQQIEYKYDSFDIDNGGLSDAFSHTAYDVVVHTAVNYGRNIDTINQLIESNITFPIELLHNSAKYSAGCFINAGTILDRNVSLYALSKAQFVEWMFVYRKRIKCINLRIEYMYGPKDDKNKFIDYIISRLLDNVNEISLTPGEQKRDFIFINDVVIAFMYILENVKKFDSFSEFDIGSGVKTSIKDLVLLIYKLINNGDTLKTKLNFGAMPYRENEKMDIDVDIDPLVNMGWLPEKKLVDGLIETINGIIDEKK